MWPSQVYDMADQKQAAQLGLDECDRRVAANRTAPGSTAPTQNTLRQQTLPQAMQGLPVRHEARTRVLPEPSITNFGVEKVLEVRRNKSGELTSAKLQWKPTWEPARNLEPSVLTEAEAMLPPKKRKSVRF